MSILLFHAPSDDDGNPATNYRRIPARTGIPPFLPCFYHSVMPRRTAPPRFCNGKAVPLMLRQ